MIIRKCLIVKELQDDMTIDGLLQKYDDSAPYMYGIVVDGEKSLLDKLGTIVNLGEPAVISFFRVNKTPYNGNYLVDFDNIIEIMSKSDYEKRKGGK